MAAAVQVFIVADEVVVGFHLPECCPCAFQHPVSLTRAEPFPALQDFAQRPVRSRTPHHWTSASELVDGLAGAFRKFVGELMAGRL